MDRGSGAAAKVTLGCGESPGILVDVSFGAGRSASVSVRKHLMETAFKVPETQLWLK